jgi:hypothetical protein
MFQGFFEWVMGMITYVLSFFGIIISKPSAGSTSGGSNAVENQPEAESQVELSQTQ